MNVDVSGEVKVWNKLNVSMQSVNTSKASRKFGPFKGLSKSAARELTASLIAEASKQVDWYKHDEKLFMKPKFVPAIKVCRPTGR